MGPTAWVASKIKTITFEIVDPNGGRFFLNPSKQLLMHLFWLKVQLGYRFMGKFEQNRSGNFYTSLGSTQRQQPQQHSTQHIVSYGGGGGSDGVENGRRARP